MSTVSALFTPESMTAFAGASGAVWAGTNALRVLIVKRESLWIAFALSQLVAYLGAAASGALTSATGPTTSASLNLVIVLIVTFFNGCLLFCTAVGIQSAASPPPAPPLGPQPAAAAPPRWLGPWKRPRR